jgi:YHS domain-containing protein
MSGETPRGGTRPSGEAFDGRPTMGANPHNPGDAPMRTYVISALAGAVALGLATSAFAAKGEFNNLCAQGLATNQQIKTDCSVNATIKGKTYCFGSEQAKQEFMKNPDANLSKAESFYSKSHG